MLVGDLAPESHASVSQPLSTSTTYFPIFPADGRCLQSLASSEDEGDEAGLPRFEEAHREEASMGETAGSGSAHGGGVWAVAAGADAGDNAARDAGEQERESAAKHNRGNWWSEM